MKQCILMWTSIISQTRKSHFLVACLAKIRVEDLGYGNIFFGQDSKRGRVLQNREADALTNEDLDGSTLDSLLSCHL